VPSTLHPLPSRRSRLALAGAVLALAVPVAGCGGGSSSSGGTGDADPAAVVPAAAAFYGELTVRPTGDVKANVESLAKKVTGTADPGQKLVALLDKSLSSSGRSFKKDIDPWLGNKVGVAVTGLRGSNPDYVIVLDAKDTGKGIATLKKSAKKVVERKYKGVTYLYNATENQAAVAEKGTVSIGTETAIRAVIDVDKGADALADSTNLKKARDNADPKALGFFYADPAGLLNLAASSNPLLGSQASSLQGLLGSAKPLTATLTAQPDALRLQTAVESAKAAKANSEAADTVAALPDGSVLALGFGTIGSQASQGVAQVQKLGGIFAGVLGQFTAITGLDLQRDVLSWMGKGGLFVRAKGLADIGGALVVDTSSEQKTTAFIASARRLITQFGGSQGLKLTPFSGSGAKGFSLKISQLPFPIIVATGGGKFVVAVGESSVAQALKPTGKLGDDPQFKATATQLGTKPIFYVDLKSLVGFAQLALGNDATFKQAEPYLTALTALAAGSDVSGKTVKTSLVVGVK
jgi:hypothetical protein